MDRLGFLAKQARRRKKTRFFVENDLNSSSLSQAPLNKTPNVSLLYKTEIDSMLPYICSVTDHRRRQNVVRTTVTHLAIASCATFLLSHFHVICDLLLNRRTATWNLFVKLKPCTVLLSNSE